MKLKSMNHVPSLIRRCDVILKNGQEQFVGLYFDSANYDRPIVLFKYDGGFNYFLSKTLELMPVPCVEHKTLTRALFENTTEGDFIDTTYLLAVAKVYSNLEKFKDIKESFDEDLNNDVVTLLYNLEEVICKRGEKKFLKKTVYKNDKQIAIEDVRGFLCRNISELSEEYGMDCKIIHNTSKRTDEYYLETVIEEYDFDLWLMVIVSSENQKIYVGNRSIFRSFDLCEAELVVKYVKYLIQITNRKLKRDIKIYCKEFKLNPRLYDIANNSITTMLEMNYNRTGIEYGINVSMKTQFMVFLTDIKDNSKMYEVCITYNEFLRNPDVFKKLIEEPKIRKKWNFWSRRKKYRLEFFDKKFQPIEP